VGLVIVVGVAVVLGVAVTMAQRLDEIFCLSVRDGRVLVVRGRIAGPLLHDLTDAVQRSGVRRAPLRAVRGPRGARLTTSGDIDELVEQRLRNIFSVYPASRLMAAPPLENPTLGQVLGIAWLAWLFDSSLR